MISTAHSPRLAARFGQNTFVIRSETPLAEDQMRRAAPSIFAEGKHGSRSERYTYIPTIDVLRGLRHEGFEPFMVAQSKSRIEGKTEFTKHMIRMRHAGQVNMFTPVGRGNTNTAPPTHHARHQQNPLDGKNRCWTSGNKKAPEH